MSGAFDLERFVAAQAECIGQVRAELQRGRKQTHWMWFVFPQIEGLGSSSMARRYALSGRGEAAAYYAHPVLGPRLCELTGIVTARPGSDAFSIFGQIDAVKFRSSLTLFGQAVSETTLFAAALTRFFGGEEDEATVAILRRQEGQDAP